MSEYTEKALEFLNACQAELSIVHIGKAVNHLWDDKETRDMYSFVIKTQRGSMNGTFWDSLHNTRLRELDTNGACIRKYGFRKECCDKSMIAKAVRELKEEIADAEPNAYNILACLGKYEVGSMDDFMQEFGYEIKSAKDMANFIQIYNAVVKEYNDLCRIFTTEQMEMLREIC